MIYARIQLQAYILPTWILAPVICMQAPALPPTAPGQEGEPASGSTGRGGGGIVAYLHVSWCTHGNMDVVHICTESWDALVVKYGAKVKISRNDTSQWIQLHLMCTQWKDVDQRYVSGRNFYLHTLYTAR